VVARKLAVITLDTSAIFTLLNRKDKDYGRVFAALQAARPPFYIPTGVLAEIGYMVEQRLGQAALLALLQDIQNQNFILAPSEVDIPRATTLVDRYDDLPLGLADSLVIACAERHGGNVLTLDGDFWVVAKEGTLQVFPL
jgi:uncharacterized protein